MNFAISLLLAVLASTVIPEQCEASRVNHGVPRRLTQVVTSSKCPDGCADGFCYSDTTGGVTGYRCLQCVNNLFLRRADGQCGCPSGRYSPNGSPTCVDCPMMFYCLGGVFTFAEPPTAIRCPANTTTRGRRSTSDRACVNLPGFSYGTLNDAVVAEPCPANTFGPGLRKQRTCVPCPTGFSTMGLTMQTFPSACVLPPGYYLKSPGQVAPCPEGEYKSGTASEANCQKCAVGVTTPGVASTSSNNCTMLHPGWYAASMNGSTITAARACPQGYYCPGGPAQQVFNATNPGSLNPGEASIKACPSGMWTTDIAAIAVEQCLTPPGFKTVGGSTVPCEAGSYRAGWAAAGAATTCISCGTGVLAQKTDRVTQYDMVSYIPIQVAVTTSSDDCYILPGQGLHFETISQSWRARNCITNSYGVDKITYGLAPYPCRACPLNQITSTNSTGFPNSASWFVNSTSGAGGFTSVRACVNPAGYGYNSRTAQPCDRGTYNTQDTYGTCTPCGYGLTTAGVGAGTSLASCGLAAGFGWSAAQNAVVPCAIGTYNNVSYSTSPNGTCTACPTGTTTPNTAAVNGTECSLCTGGYGGANCQTRCGGKGANATYADSGRPMGTECTTCSWSTTGFSFNWGQDNDLFSAQALAPVGADSSWDCVSEFTQISDGAWYLPTTGNTAMNITANVSTFAACVALCIEPDCQYVTYDYRTQTCYVRIGYEPIYMGAPLIAFKAVPSGDVATNAYSVRTPGDGAQAASLRAQHRHGATNDIIRKLERFRRPAKRVDPPSDTLRDGREQVTASSAVHGAAVSSGQYSFYVDPNADSVGYQTAAPGRSSFASGLLGLQQCLDACDDQSWCAGITMQLYVDRLTSPRSCNLIAGDTRPGRFLRSVTRADVHRLSVPDVFSPQP